MTIKEATQKLNIKSDFIPKGSANRPGTSLDLEYITIHNTANSSKGANARVHGRYLKGVDAKRRKVSWHMTVDEDVVIKHLPLSEVGWHAGDSEGNRKSIGIEICENSDQDQKKANERAVLLTALLCHVLNIPVDKVVPHQRWSGKYCPHLILDSPGGFRAFREQVRSKYKEIE
jgi:N-acetylmuramoyl-L-alanine amidase CwlA